MFVTNAEQNKSKRLSLASFIQVSLLFESKDRAYPSGVLTVPPSIGGLLTRKYLTSPEENRLCTNPPAYLALPWVTKEKKVLTLTQSHVKLILAKNKKTKLPWKIFFLRKNTFFGGKNIF